MLNQNYTIEYLIMSNIYGIDLSSSEFTGIINREQFILLSKDVGEDRWNAYRERWESANNYGKTEYPIQIDFELNGTCNLKCKMCPMSEPIDDKGKVKIFDFETFKILIDEGINKGLECINLSYVNEPLIRKDLSKFIKYAKNKGIVDIYFSTNGLLLNDKNIRELIDSGLSRIQISIDAYTEKMFKIMRYGANLNKLLPKIDNLLKIRKEMNSLTPLVRVNFVRTKVNDHELEDFVSFWKDKVDMIGIQEFVNFRESTTEFNNTPLEEHESTFKCRVPFKEMVVRYDGTVLPCCNFPGMKMPIGNVFETSVEDLWNGKQINDLRQLHLEGRYRENEICKQCVEGA